MKTEHVYTTRNVIGDCQAAFIPGLAGPGNGRWTDINNLRGCVDHTGHQVTSRRTEQTEIVTSSFNVFVWLEKKPS